MGGAVSQLYRTPHDMRRE